MYCVFALVKTDTRGSVFCGTVINTVVVFCVIDCPEVASFLLLFLIPVLCQQIQAVVLVLSCSGKNFWNDPFRSNPGGPCIKIVTTYLWQDSSKGWRSNFAVEMLASLRYIREVLGSIWIRRAANLIFLHALLRILQDIFTISAYFHSLYNLLFTKCSVIRRYVI